jgi:hypothetical protein
MSNNGWIGVDLDGTLAVYHGWKSDGSVGDPVPLMVARVKYWLKNGVDVRIVTARVNPKGKEQFPVQFLKQEKIISEWCLTHIGQVIPIGYEKDLAMIELWDDRAVQIIANTGVRVDGKA